MQFKKLSIAIVVYSHYSRDARIRRYAEYLASSGARVDVICLRENYIPKEKNINLTMYPLPRKRLGWLWYFLEYIFFFIFVSIVLTFKFFKRKYAIVHINNMPEILVFAALIPKLFNSKIILDMHDPMPELYISKFNSSYGNMIVRLIIFWESASFNFADRILTANNSFRTLFLSRNPRIKNKITVILNCPDPEIFKTASGIKKDRFTLCYMGTVDKRFGLDTVIDSLPRLVKEIPNIKFVVIPKLDNEGGHFQELKNKITHLDLSGYVEIRHPIPLEEVARFLSGVDLGVVLSKNGVFTNNIFPVKLLEFVQTGIPVIASKTKTLTGSFSDRQIYFLPENTSLEFEKAVIKLFHNPSLRVTLTRNAVSYLKDHNWPDESLKYLKMINSLKSRN